IQSIEITGVIKSQEGEPLPGVTVSVKDQPATGVSSNENGEYILTVPNSNSVLVYSMIGFVKQEITVGSRTRIDVTLESDQQVLENVVVVGYGTQKKVNL